MTSAIAGKDAKEQYLNECASLGELKMMRHMSRFGTRLLRFAYACVYDLHEAEVEVTLNDPSGLNIESADDIKSLHETNTLLPSDKLKLRKRLMQNT